MTKELKNEFEPIFWYSLRSAPPLEDVLRRCVLFLSDQQQLNIPEDTNGQIHLLIQYLKAKRCIIVLDNFDTLLQEGDSAGQYRAGYEDYGRLLQSVGEGTHQSCILLTSREKPNEIAYLEEKRHPFAR